MGVMEEAPATAASESPNLAVRIGKMTMRNPVTTGSGTFGFGSETRDLVDLERIGAVCVKATTSHARVGNPPARIIENRSGEPSPPDGEDTDPAHPPIWVTGVHVGQRSAGRFLVEAICIRSPWSSRPSTS